MSTSVDMANQLRGGKRAKFVMRVFTDATVIEVGARERISSVKLYISGFGVAGSLYTGQDLLLTVRIQSAPASGYCQTIAPPPATTVSTATGGFHV